MSLARGLLASALVAFALFAAWRILAITEADRWARQDPQRALHWMSDHPRARLALAERKLAEGDLEAARAAARRLLAAEPLAGRGFRVLADVAARQEDREQALALYRIAARRSPRDVRTRAWLTGHYLAAGEGAMAMEQIDAMLRTAPRLGDSLYPLLTRLATEPAFAERLAHTLRARPAWRGALLSTLQAAPDPSAADNVLSALRRLDGLDEAEFDRWIDYLMRRGRWGEAYGRWAGTLPLDGAALPAVYNGDFERPVSSRGFDWHLRRIPGVSVTFVPDHSARGLVAHASFRGRPVPQVNLEQPLLLAPGTHRFSARVRADALRSERGLEWTVQCVGRREPLARSEPLQGSFGWRTIVMEVNVPVTGCAGQWLRIRNPVPAGSIQQVSGDLWFDDVVIQSSE